MYQALTRLEVVGFGMISSGTEDIRELDTYFVDVVEEITP